MSLVNYLKETKAELVNVNWLNKKQSLIFTSVIILVSVLVALFLGFFDFIFSKLLNFIISN